MLTNEERARWQREGYLVLPDLIAPDQRAALPEWAEMLASWTPRSSEPIAMIQDWSNGRLVTTEAVADQLPAVDALLRHGPLEAMAAVLLGEPAVLHRDLIRFEPSSSLGRQLIHEANYIDRHIGCFVGIDRTGVVEVATSSHRQQLGVDRAGHIDHSSLLPWVSIVLEAGDTLWLHRLTPHRWVYQRRTLELTYSARAQGDLRAALYVLRRRQVRSIGNKRSARSTGQPSQPNNPLGP